MKTTRLFDPEGDRYQFDFTLCTTSKGWAQVDTSQDASYFGTWASPTKRQILQFLEGDIILQEAESDEEFTSELRTFAQWQADNGHTFKGIDPGFNAELKARFLALGLSDLIH
jgi:hypothetical protein